MLKINRQLRNPAKNCRSDLKVIYLATFPVISQICGILHYDILTSGRNMIEIKAPMAITETNTFVTK